MKKYGIQLDEVSGDLKIKNGHLSLGNTLGQNQYIIMLSQKGEIKEYPTLGVGIADMLNDNDIIGWKRKIRVEFESDGMKVGKVSISNDGHIESIEADYK